MHAEDIRKARFPTLTRLVCVLLLVIPLSACQDTRFPRDPDNTLETVLSTGQMTVAAVDHVPWVVVDNNDPPHGAEVELVERFARDLGVSVIWQRMSAFEALEGLGTGDFDLAIGGFARESVSTPGAAPTYAYFHEALVIGARPDALTDELGGQKVFVPAAEAVSELVRDKDGVPVSEWSDAVNFAALPRWQLEAWDLVPTGIVLRRSDHVMAIPQGENAWLMQVETFLRHESDTMADRLREHH